ncbi:hypothetical protein R75461_05274 [Paraburkholderia nemoris]|uniref:hypothetical protein n=1 Tax=Paraburkholderia nemoris TaxID=2793076 RepID=UPI00190B8D20|nr:MULTISPECIES: hypothetical protein [Paraburkholderia]MBK3783934.1 hypothetical protein [Paraburkholderia aspalathi]MBK5148046.1 hypothetical protein [Burkholderia sp. R-69608]CAE6802911.1 hypothetical protein R75461_05274 [Paraburkholderia nemoris]CAE6876211.1 hypothetical protein R69608_01424 [Paraburkholderia nemoris]
MALDPNKIQTSLVLTLDQKKQIIDYTERTGATLAGTVRIALNQFFASQNNAQAKEVCHE